MTKTPAAIFKWNKNTTPKKCDICHEEHFLNTQSCEACNKVVKKYQNKTKFPMEEVRKALEEAY